MPFLVFKVAYRVRPCVRVVFIACQTHFLFVHYDLFGIETEIMLLKDHFLKEDVGH